MVAFELRDSPDEPEGKDIQNYYVLAEVKACIIRLESIVGELAARVKELEESQ